jgi:hypothetical protein
MGDTALDNWKGWLEKRGRLSAGLSRALGRKPDRLLMNAHLEYSLNREKWLIEEGSNYLSPDQYRGHPLFWSVPTSLTPGNLGYIPNHLQFLMRLYI